MAMQARISTIEGDAGKIDDAVKIINEKILPAVKGLQGFTAVNFLADRSAGRLVAVAFYADEAALEGSVEAVGLMRTEVADAMGGKVVSGKLSSRLRQRVHRFVCMSTSGFGWLIHAAVGSFGGTGRLAKRSG